MTTRAERIEKALVERADWMHRNGIKGEHHDRHSFMRDGWEGCNSLFCVQARAALAPDAPEPEKCRHGIYVVCGICNPMADAPEPEKGGEPLCKCGHPRDDHDLYPGCKCEGYAPAPAPSGAPVKGWDLSGIPGPMAADTLRDQEVQRDIASGAPDHPFVPCSDPEAHGWRDHDETYECHHGGYGGCGLPASAHLPADQWEREK